MRRALCRLSFGNHSGQQNSPMNRSYKGVHLPRRELVRLIGRRGNRLTNNQAAFAWLALSKLLEENLSEKDIPKFADLAHAVRFATLLGRQLPFVAVPGDDGQADVRESVLAQIDAALEGKEGKA